MASTVCLLGADDSHFLLTVLSGAGREGYFGTWLSHAIEFAASQRKGRVYAGTSSYAPQRESIHNLGPHAYEKPSLVLMYEAPSMSSFTQTTDTETK